MKLVGYLNLSSTAPDRAEQMAMIERWAKSNGHIVRTYRGVLESAICAANRGEAVAVCSIDCMIQPGDSDPSRATTGAIKGVQRKRASLVLIEENLSTETEQGREAMQLLANQ